MLFITYLCHLFSGRCMPELRFAITQQQKSILIYGPLTQVLATLAVSICLNTESTLLWMDDKASSPSLKTRIPHRSRHSKSMDNTSLIHSFIHSDIFIFTIGT